MVKPSTANKEALKNSAEPASCTMRVTDCEHQDPYSANTECNIPSI